MATVRELWSDERLDDLNHRVDRGFEDTKAEFRALRLEMHAEFAAVRAEMTALHRTTMQIVLGGFGLMLVGFAGTIATVLTAT